MEKIVNQIADKFNLNCELALLAYNRGINSIEKANEFFAETELKFFDPYLLSGMTLAVERINFAIEKRQNVLVFGDYDADGICASAILSDFLKSKDVSCDVFIPERQMGYGITLKAIEQIEKNNKYDLLITVDCGISSHKEIEIIKEMGIDVIVTDHHNIPEILPNCITINPKLKNQKYPFDELCGAGVALKLVCAMDKSKFNEYVDIAGIATIGDSVPLVSENRNIVKIALKNINEKPKKFITAINSVLDKKTLWKSDDIAFYLAPMINAAGRLENANIAYEFITEKSDEKIFTLAHRLRKINEQRKEFCTVAGEIIEKQITEQKLFKNKFISVVTENVPHGIIGIVASKVVEKYNRPAFVFENQNGILKGSARSIEGINLFELLSKCKHLFLGFGGHSMAAGLSLKEENFEHFCSCLQNLLKDVDVEKFKNRSSFKYDIKFREDMADMNFYRQLSKFQPFGCQNEEPFFSVQADSFEYESLKKNMKYIKIATNIKDFKLMNFEGDKVFDILDCNVSKKMFFKLCENQFRGQSSLSGKFVDIASTFSVDEMQNVQDDSRYIEQLFYANETQNNLKNIEFANVEQFTSILNQKTCDIFGTLVVCSTVQAVEFLKNNVLPGVANAKNIVQVQPYAICGCESLNTIAICAGAKQQFDKFENVFIIDEILSKGYLSDICQKNRNTNFIVLTNESIAKNSVVQKLNVNREEFIKYYALLTKIKGINAVAFDLHRWYNIFKRFNNQIDRTQFMFCFGVFVELGVISIDSVSGVLSVNTENKVDLEKSIAVMNINEIKSTMLV